MLGPLAPADPDRCIRRPSGTDKRVVVLWGSLDGGNSHPVEVVLKVDTYDVLEMGFPYLIRDTLAS